MTVGVYRTGARKVWTVLLSKRLCLMIGCSSLAVHSPATNKDREFLSSCATGSFRGLNVANEVNYVGGWYGVESVLLALNSS